MNRIFNEDLLPELRQMEFIMASSSPWLNHKVIAEVPCENQLLPIHAFSLGNTSPDVPVMNFIGGVHGLERIGTQVVLAYLETLLARLQWDSNLALLLEKVRINVIPLINPVGMAFHTRSNGNSVDLMRNAPLSSEEKTAFLVGGHRITKILPWYRGANNAEMEIESKALCDFTERDSFSAPLSMVLDCHSGFGISDRIWFPYAKSKLQPITHLGEMYHLRELLFQSFPHQDYIFEPQAKHYLCHGDLWDYMYDMSLNHNTTFLPLTLEMGSWRWVKKNPLQLLKTIGLYHPMKPHRIKRVLRGHLILMDFLTRAAASQSQWLGVASSEALKHKAKSLWYNHL